MCHAPFLRSFFVLSRIRSIHPSLFTDDDFVELSSDAKILLIGIWTECDDFGLFEWKPKRLKMRIFPADNVEINDVISELVGNGFVTSYELEGNKYGAIKNFCKWQKPKKPNNFCPFNKEIAKFVRYEFRTGGELVGNWWVKSISEGRKGGREEGKKGGKEEGKNIPPEDNKQDISSSTSAPEDENLSWINKQGVQYLISHQKRPKQEVTTILDGWLQFNSTEDVRKAIQTCQVSARGDPINYIIQILNNAKSKNGIGNKNYQQTDDDDVLKGVRWK